jgi:hypothetical protein
MVSIMSLVCRRFTLFRIPGIFGDSRPGSESSLQRHRSLVRRCARSRPLVSQRRQKRDLHGRRTQFKQLVDRTKIRSSGSQRSRATRLRHLVLYERHVRQQFDRQSDLVRVAHSTRVTRRRNDGISVSRRLQARSHDQLQHASQSNWLVLMHF